MNPNAYIKEKRPTEAITGLGLAGLIYGWLTDHGVDPVLAAIVAVVIAFVPTGISEGVDAARQW
jgi:hypothetical protein